MMELMDHELAREALSARIDGEREPVPSARVDEHLAGCASCRAWYERALEQSRGLRIDAVPAVPDLAGAIVSGLGDDADRLDDAGSRGRLGHRSPRVGGARIALAVVGLLQTAVATAQMAGVDFGMLTEHDHGGRHLLNETSAFTLAGGVAMLLAAVWPAAATGLAVVLGVYVVVLAGFVTHDLVAGVVTAERVLSHVPVLLGALAAALLARTHARIGPVAPAAGEIVLPTGASLGRRRGHLRAADDG